MKVSVDYRCEACGAIGEGFRDLDDMGAEECWNCGRDEYRPSVPEHVCVFYEDDDDDERCSICGETWP